VKIFWLGVALWGGMAALGWGQDLPLSLAAEAEVGAPEPPDLLPRTLAWEPQVGPTSSPCSIGPVGGYLVTRGADHGTWFGGLASRGRFSHFALEASVTAHESEFQKGDVRETQVPIQVTAFFYPLTLAGFRPYLLGGVGWYYTRFQYRGSLSGLSDRSEGIYGIHAGAGFEVMFGPTSSFDLDARYNYFNKSDPIIDHDFNYWQLTVGINFFF
jgi:opacity protein-like surface antigen